ncbi:antirestriction protein ArdA [Candidatus Pacearchaeota archaeon]|nr:antirestriction protein ArdA [Candidatus Pacearchaeota archaeon]
MTEIEWTEEEQDIIDASHYDEEVFEAARECGIEFENVDEAYNGAWSSDENFVQQLLEDTGCIPSDLPGYVHIDWESTARDIMMDYCEHDGHYFRNL